MTDQELRDEIAKIRRLPDDNFSNINPASGLPMIGGSGVDIAGDAYGQNSDD